MPLSAASVGKRGKRFVQRADARWLMAYAAGIGQSSPRYFDTTARNGEQSALVAHPLFPVCVEWPVILDLPNIEHQGELEVQEAGRGVHALHDLHLHRPIVAGETLYTTATIVGVEARKPGAFQSLRLDSVDGEGRPVATTWQGSLYRGVAVSGSDKVAQGWPEMPPLPPVLQPAGEDDVVISAGAAHVYTECARIFNPIHTDRSVALAAGLPDIILHGTASLAHAVNVVIDKCLVGDSTRVRRVAGRFAGMVLMPERLRVRLRHADSSGCFFAVEDSGGSPVITAGYIGFDK